MYSKAYVLYPCILINADYFFISIHTHLFVEALAIVSELHQLSIVVDITHILDVRGFVQYWTIYWHWQLQSQAQILKVIQIELLLKFFFALHYLLGGKRPVRVKDQLGTFEVEKHHQDYSEKQR